jgi:hypothetical protein
MSKMSPENGREQSSTEQNSNRVILLKNKPKRLKPNAKDSK